MFTNDVVTIQKSVCGTRSAVDVAEFRERLPTRMVAPLDSCGRRAELATCDRNYKASNTEPLQISGSRVTKRLLGVDRPAAFAISPFRTGARQHGALSGGAELKLVVSSELRIAISTNQGGTADPVRGAAQAEATHGARTRNKSPWASCRVTLPGASTLDLWDFQRFTAASTVQEGDLRVSVHGWVE